MNGATLDLPRILPAAPEAEQAVLSSVLLDFATLETTREYLAVEDFYSTRHQRIYRAMLDLAECGESIDNITLTSRLGQKGQLEEVGGSSYLAELIDIVPSSVNIKSHCLLVKNTALNRLIIRQTHSILDHAYAGNNPDELFSRLRGISERKPEGKPTLSIALVSYKDLLSLELPERPRYLPWLMEGGNIMVFGPRGVGKTFLQLGLAVALTTGRGLLKWDVVKPAGVLYVDGEMQLDELRERTTALMDTPPAAPLEFLTSQLVYQRCGGKDLVLTSESMRQEIVKILDARPDIRVVILDNISCLFSGINEDSKQDWEPINAWLIRLRHRGIATVLVHHAGKGGQQRGTSGREDSLDTVIQLTKPVGGDPTDGCHFELHFTKCRSVSGDDVAPLDVRLEATNGRLQLSCKLLEVSKVEQAQRLYAEGVTSPSDLAEELGITKGYASKLLKRIKAEGRQ